jgi:adenine C2-methylase RlmN of 23S rRNA A2503 and tRNA A37
MLSLEEIAKYHEDVVSSLSYLFSDQSTYFTERFIGYSPAMIAEELRKRVDETSLRSILIILASLEARFRVDYESRCQKKLKDDLSRAFRAIYKEKQERVSLEQGIFEVWKDHQVESKQLIGELKTAFGFRHWLAHGRYWQPKLGKSFDYESVYDLATSVNEEFFGDESVRP